MMGWLAFAASAAPVLGVPVQDGPLTRCAADADAQAGLDEQTTTVPLGEHVDRVAIVVGVPCHRATSIPSLAYSTRDAVRVADRLTAQGYAVRRLTSIVDAAELEAALDEAERALAPGGSLVVYFSGHGVLREVDGQLRRFLVFSDTDLARIEHTAWPVRRLDDRVSRMPATSRVVIQDTCFAAEAGGGSKSVGASEGQGRNKGLSLPEGRTSLQPGDLRLYASRFYEQALESIDHRGSVYTHHLLEALEDPGADLDGDGCVGALEAHVQARDRTETERGGFQVPQLHALQPHNLHLGCQPSAPTHAVVVEPSPDWELELRRDDEVHRGAGALEPGRWRVSVREWVPDRHGELELRSVLDTRLSLQAGTWLDLGSELRRRRPLGMVGVGSTVVPGGALPELAGHVEGWWASTQRGPGRLALTGVATWTPGPGRWDDPRLGFRGGTAEVGGGWWATLPVGAGNSHVALGPSVTGGALWRTARNLDTPIAELPTRAGWVITPTAHAHAAAGPVILGVDFGLRTNGVVDESGPGLQWAPLARISVGPRL